MVFVERAGVGDFVLTVVSPLAGAAAGAALGAEPAQSPLVCDTTLGGDLGPVEVSSTVRLQLPLPVLVDT